MTDRFNFRYFNTISNKMVECTNYQNVDAIFECLKQQVCYNNDISPLPYDHIGNGLVFMQCTGLKDKNGKLIYEGDIIKTSKGVANVEYDNTYAYFGLTNFLTVFSFDNFINEEIEVIGNIYENPELLEVENDR